MAVVLLFGVVVVAINVVDCYLCHDCCSVFAVVVVDDVNVNVAVANVVNVMVAGCGKNQISKF